MSISFKYIFGPVASRRFGRSLGVDLLPYKVCSFNCVFCEVGLTSHQTVERKEYVPTEEVIKELQLWRSLNITADVITIAGSGEPTLHSYFGRIIDEVNSWQIYPTLLLTNSSLMFLPEVRQEAAKAKIVKASLSAFDQASFNLICRPHPTLIFDKIVEGLFIFRKEFLGQLWLEVFIVPDLNDTPEAVANIAKLAKELHPDKIQLNTAVRPAPESFVRAANQHKLQELAMLFDPVAEVIGSFNFKKTPALDRTETATVSENQVIELIKRRPSTLKEIALAFNVDERNIDVILKKLINNRTILYEERNGETFYYI